jgi:hypothetical protein
MKTTDAAPFEVDTTAADAADTGARLSFKAPAPCFERFAFAEK